MRSDPSAERDHRPTQTLWLVWKLVVLAVVLNVLLVPIHAPASLMLFLNGILVAGALVSYVRIALTTERPAEEAKPKVARTW